MDLVVLVEGAKRHTVTVAHGDDTDTLKKKIADACELGVNTFSLIHNGELVGEMECIPIGDLALTSGEELLVQQKQSVPSNNQREVLEAIKTCNTEKLQSIKDSGGDVMFDINTYPHPFLLACSNGDVKVVQWYLSQDADPNLSLSSRRSSPLTQACSCISHRYGSWSEYRTLKESCNKADAVRTLLDAGANPKTRTFYLDQTPIYNVHFGEMAVALLSHDPTLLDTVDSEGNTPLHNYAGRSATDVVKHITDYIDSSLYSCQNLEGNLPMQASAYPHGCAALLVPPDDSCLTHVNKKGETLLHSAVEQNCEVLSILLARGAHTDVKDKRGNTPLHICTTVASATLLLDAGCNIDEVDKEGRTALYLACYWRREDLAKFLVSRGASLRIKAGGWTPVAAALHGHEKGPYARSIVSVRHNCFVTWIIVLWTGWFMY